jgi:metal-dependent amidase/aminoacylase/carboxypeptidase family protein
VRQRLCERVTQIATSVAAAHGATAEVSLEPGYPVLKNDPAALDHAFAAARQVGFADGCIQVIPPIGGGEDFAYFCQSRPGAFVFLGAGSAEGCAYPHHHPRFNIDEAALPHGTALLASIALGDREHAARPAG